MKQNIKTSREGSNDAALRMEAFNREHYATYLSWFENPLIKSALYEIDEEWLEFVLNDKSGAEYVFLSGNELIAVVGIEFPASSHPNYAIKNIAVNPRVHRKGIGSLVLDMLFEKHPLKIGELWIAYVEKKNTIAQTFFTNNGWVVINIEEDMLKFKNQ